MLNAVENMSQSTRNTVHTACRLILSLTILWIVVGNFLDMNTAVAYAQAKGVPFANLLVPLAQAILGASGLMILLGYRPRLGLFVYMLFLLVVTPVMHQWWNITGFEQILEIHYFQANVMLFALAGMLLATGDNWPYTITDMLQG